MAFEMEFMDKQGNMIKLAIRCQIFFKDDTQVQHAPSFSLPTPLGLAWWLTRDSCRSVQARYSVMCADQVLGSRPPPWAMLGASSTLTSAQCCLVVCLALPAHPQIRVPDGEQRRWVCRSRSSRPRRSDSG